MKNFLIPLLLTILLALPGSAISASENVGAMLPQTKSGKTVKSVPYSGNVKTLKYHSPGCKFYDCKTCTRFFKSAQEAQKAGFEPCQKCGG